MANKKKRSNNKKKRGTNAKNTNKNYKNQSNNSQSSTKNEDTKKVDTKNKDTKNEDTLIVKTSEKTGDIAKKTEEKIIELKKNEYSNKKKSTSTDEDTSKNNDTIKDIKNDIKNDNSSNEDDTITKEEDVKKVEKENEDNVKKVEKPKKTKKERIKKEDSKDKEKDINGDDNDLTDNDSETTQEDLDDSEATQEDLDDKDIDISQDEDFDDEEIVASKQNVAISNKSTKNDKDEDSSDDKEVLSSYADMPDDASKIIHGNSSVYRSSEAKYNDYISSALILAVLGVLGFVFTILNIFKVFKLFTTTFQYICSLAMFIAFIVISVYCYRIAMFNKNKISKEQVLKGKVIAYLKEKITNDILKSFDIEGESEESNYLARLDGLKDMVMKQFPYIDEAFAESLVEVFYTENY